MTENVNIWDLADLCTPWCVHVAATLRIADQIANGNHLIDDISRAANCDRDALHAVLGHLVGKGLFTESKPGYFTLNNAARQLLDPTARASLDLEDIGGRFAHAWSTLLKFTRTGAPAYQDVYGLPFFEDLNAHPEIAASFDAMIGPAGHGTPNPEFDITGGWEAIKTVMDIGGGTGAFLAEILRLHPHLNGILVDQPETVARSAEIFQEAGVVDRVQAVGQSFFDPLPEGADLYLLRGIVNDWPDREARAILRRCADAARASADRPAGRVVVLKSVQPDGTPKDLTIEMILLGGKHRTLAEFRSLAQEAGLKVISTGQQVHREGMNSGYYVECRPI